MAILSEPAGSEMDVDLLLVALMDLSATDGEIRELAQARITSLGPDPALALGLRLLERGKTTPTHSERGRPT